MKSATLHPDDLLRLKATMLGYVAGLADNAPGNPYAYIQEEAWCWQHGFEQGRIHAVRCAVREPTP